MSSHRQQDVGDGVRVLTLGGAPGNPLDAAARGWLDQAVRAAQDDPAVAALVITGAGGVFSTGIDAPEHGGTLALPWIDTLCETVEECSKPVVAAIEGSAIGAGFALALAAHARVAHAGARVGVPEVRLGMVPTGGVTQRLPRLAGAQTSLTLMLSGRPVPVTDAGLRAVFDRIVTDDTRGAAIACARALAQEGRWSRSGERRTGFADASAYLSDLHELVQALEPEAHVERAVTQAVEAAILLPLPQGLALEATLFDETRKAPAAIAARHLLCAERSAGSVPGVDVAAARPVRDVVLTGPRGAFAETAIMALDAGWNVHLDPQDDGAGAAIRNRIGTIYAAAVARGRLEPATRAARLARLHADAHAAAITEALVFEMGGPGPASAAGAVRVRVTADPDLPGGADMPAFRLWLAPPAHSVPLAELSIAHEADPQQAATLVRALGQARKMVIRSGNAPGMIARSLEWALWSGALALVGAGVGVYDVDRGARRLGLAQGPFRQMDALGLDVAAARLDQLSRALGAPVPDQTDALHVLAAAGRTGRQAGEGFYRYADGDVSEHPDIAAFLPSAQGVDIDVEAALEAAIVNRSARLLRVGTALRASDIDVVLVRVLGVARERGGLLIQADMKGLFALSEAMKPLAALAPHIWTPDDGLLDRVRNGRGFFDPV